MYSLIIEIKIWTPKSFSNMIESKDYAENKIYHVIFAAILKKANLGTFPKDIFGKLFSL